MAARDLSKWSVLHHAAFHGQTHVLQALLQREVAVKGGEFVNLKDRWGRTALAYAVANAHLDAYRVLRVRLERYIRNPNPEPRTPNAHLDAYRVLWEPQR